MKTLISINPAKNFEKVGEVAFSSESEIKQRVQEAHAVKEAWKNIGVKERVKLLKNVYDTMQKYKDDIAHLDSQEMGFPITQCYDFNLGDAFSYFSWNLENAEKYLAPEIIYEDASSIHTVYHEPRGVVAVIQPWNFPFCQWSWSVVSTLLAGNVVVYKPSEEVPLSAQLLEKILSECDLPKGVLSFVYGDGTVGEILINQNIDMISFTGSVATGKKLYIKAAEKFIPILLELGGSAPGVVFEDVNVDETVDALFWQRFANCGQICDGLKRLLVHESLIETVTEKLKKKLENSPIGDPMKKETVFGPLVAERQVALLNSQVKDALERGAKLITGGKRPAKLQGAYYEPTLLTNITKDMRVWKEEVFGPVLPIMPFRTEEEAIALANDTTFGLGGYVFTKDEKRAERVATAMHTGNVSINGANYVLPMIPFGGYKQSGLGREHGKFGFAELTQLKVITQNK